MYPPPSNSQGNPETPRPLLSTLALGKLEAAGFVPETAAKRLESYVWRLGEELWVCTAPHELRLTKRSRFRLYQRRGHPARINLLTVPRRTG